LLSPSPRKSCFELDIIFWPMRVIKNCNFLFYGLMVFFSDRQLKMAKALWTVDIFINIFTAVSYNFSK